MNTIEDNDPLGLDLDDAVQEAEPSFPNPFAIQWEEIDANELELQVNDIYFATDRHDSNLRAILFYTADGRGLKIGANPDGTLSVFVPEGMEASVKVNLSAPKDEEDDGVADLPGT